MQFDLPKEQSSIIKVLGVGGGGSNAVNHMYEQGIHGVNFVITNTDAQAMELSPVPNKIQLGPSLTEGLGAGSNPEVGKLATEESMNEVKDILEKNTKMAFVTAGMGGGTGTGGAPVIAKIAKEMGILTVGIVTTPFFFEGNRKMKQAQLGIEELRANVDSLIVISNDKIREIFGNLTRSDAFERADNILAIAAKSISEIITVPGQINVDFADVEYVMKNSGVSIMGSATAEGEERAARAVQGALSSPLLNDNSITGAKKILLNITSGTQQVLIDEITEIHEYVLEAAGQDTDVIFGTCDDESLQDKLSVTIIATGFEEKGFVNQRVAPQKVVLNLSDDKAKQEVEPPVNELRIEEKTEEVEEEQPYSLFDMNLSNDEEREESETENEPTLNSANDELEIRDETVGSFAEQTKSKMDNDVPDEPFFITSKKPEESKPEESKDQLQTPSQNDRLRHFHNYNIKLNSQKNLTDLENEPAFKRRNIQLNNVPHSSEENLSRYTLGENDDADDQGEIKKNNSFLHDNVD